MTEHDRFAGRKLAHYELLEPIGKGGMGEVYRAKDTKLGREVAIKVLPDEFARDEERLKRFQREAQVLASLNHPGIAAIYGVEHDQDTHYLVLELVPGETLADRIARGPIPVDEALDIAVKIAEALEEAHEHGIVHRDLKPANIKLTPDDKVKVLDFGLAKALEEETPAADDSMSPTITRGTQVGVILGTAAYMSPEQAKGKKVDRRTDIFAFGAVLFEMLTGNRAFAGEGPSDVLASVIKDEPNWGELPSSLPDAVVRPLRRCLRKDSQRRPSSATAVALEFEDARSFDARTIGSRERTGRVVWGLAAATLLAGVALSSWFGARSATPSARPIVRFRVDAVPGTQLPAGSQHLAVLSADRRSLVYVARTDRYQLYLRRLDENDTAPIPGTTGAIVPFFSPDSRRVGFITYDRKLKVFELDGPPPTTVAEGLLFGHASWTEGDEIVFSTFGDEPGIWSVASSGGEPRRLVTPNDGEGVNMAVVVPGTSTVLYQVVEGGAANARRRVDAFSWETGESRVVVENAGRRFDYSPSGHVVFVSEGFLSAVAFDAGTLRAAARPVRLNEDVESALNGNLQYFVSPSGDLVKRVGGGATSYRLVAVSRNNEARVLVSEPGGYHRPRWAPDGSRIAVSVTSVDTWRDIWLYEPAAEALTRFTFDPGVDTSPVWDPDGSRIAFGSSRRGLMTPFLKSADGRGEVTGLFQQDLPVAANAFTPDGATVLAASTNSAERDLWSIDTRTGVTRVLFESPHGERQPAISSDGRWLAYVSDESGRDEVYVRDYPSLEAMRQVSTEGGTEPVWSKSGAELFFREGPRLLSVQVNADRVTTPTLVFERDAIYDHSNDHPNYDVSPDGREFLMIERDESSKNGFEIVLNWSTLLEAESER